MQNKLVLTDPPSPELKGARGRALCGAHSWRATAMRGPRAFGTGTLNKHMTLSLFTGWGGHVLWPLFMNHSPVLSKG